MAEQPFSVSLWPRTFSMPWKGSLSNLSGDWIWGRPPITSQDITSAPPLFARKAPTSLFNCL